MRLYQHCNTILADVSNGANSVVTADGCTAENFAPVGCPDQFPVGLCAGDGTEWEGMSFQSLPPGRAKLLLSRRSERQRGQFTPANSNTDAKASSAIPRFQPLSDATHGSAGASPSR